MDPNSVHAHPQSRDTHSDTSVHGNHAPVARGGDARVEDHGGKILGLIALVAACIALGAVSMYVILESQLIDAKIKAGVAAAEQNAREARTTAKVTDDKLSELRDKLNAKGMNIPPLNGHD